MLVPSHDLADYSRLPQSAREDLRARMAVMQQIASASRGQIGAIIAREADSLGMSAKRLRALWDEFRQSRNWRTLIDRRRCRENASQLSAADVELFRTYAERNQRKTRPAWRALVRALRKGEITSTSPLDPITGLPKGWSERNLRRYLSTRAEVTAMRQGLGAAVAQHLGKVLTTRVGLYVGSHYMADDVLRDFKVLLLSGSAGKEARVGELGVLDVLSGHRFAVHRRPIYRGEDGVKDSIKEKEMRFLVAAVLRNQGYSPRGTEWIVELGTAAIRKPLAAWLHDHSNGSITVREAGITGREQALAGWTGRGGGNPRHKSRLESHHNLLHNESAHLLAQTGHDRNPPEWLHGVEKETQSVIKWIAQLPPERAALLRAPMLEYWQALSLLNEIDHRIASRTDHQLEGWEQCGHTCIDYRPDLTSDRWITQEQFLSLPAQAQNQLLAVIDMMPPGICARPRKLSPIEAWQRGATDLVRLPDHVIALMFCDRALGDDLRTSRRLNREGEFTVQDSTVEPGPMNFRGVAVSAAHEVIRLDDRVTYGCVINPFDRDQLWIYDARGAYLGTAPRKHRAMIGDEQAITRQLGQRSHDIATLTAPLRDRHSDITRALLDLSEHNQSVAAGAAITAEEKARARVTRKLDPATLLDTDHDNGGSASGLTQSGPTLEDLL